MSTTAREDAAVAREIGESDGSLAEAVIDETSGEVRARGYWEQVWRRFQPRPRRAREHRLPRLRRADLLPGRDDRREAARPRPGRPVPGRDRRRPDPGRPVARGLQPLHGRAGHAHPRRVGHAGPRRVPAAPLRRPRLAPGGDARDDRRDVHRHGARRRGRLLPRLDRHGRVAPDRDHDGVPGAALHHRDGLDRRQPPRQHHLRRRARQGRPDPRPRLLRSSAGSTRRGSCGRRCSRCARRSSSRPR